MKRRIKIGPVGKKLLLLLEAGIVLSLTAHPGASFKILNSVVKEWKNINQQQLRDNIRKLYESKLIGWKESHGTVQMILTDKGKKKVLEYHIDTISIPRPTRWDGTWRIVMFDIPEHIKQGRDALARKLKELGFYPIQKSVFAHPFERKDQIDFVIEVFNLARYVRFIRTTDIDIDLDLRRRFKV